MHEEDEGLKINWNIKNYSACLFVTLAGVGIIIGWFKLTVLLMGLGG